MAAQRAPLWEANEMDPSIGIFEAKDELKRVRCEVLMTPRQFGPTSRIEYFLAISAVSRSSLDPSSPTSLKPAEITTRALTPNLPHSSTTLGTAVAGTMMMARSAFSGRSRIDG